jgi:hypothetical protein
MYVFLTGCASVQVSHDYEEGRAFVEFHSYFWKSQEKELSGNAREDDPLLHKRLYSTINAVLAERGYRLNAEADFLVSYEYSIATRLESDPFSTSFGFGIGPRRHYGAFGIGTGSEVRQYDVGILIIDFFDPQTGALIWRGRGSETVSVHMSPQQTTAMVDRLVQAIIAQFPPR